MYHDLSRRVLFPLNKQNIWSSFALNLDSVNPSWSHFSNRYGRAVHCPKSGPLAAKFFLFCRFHEDMRVVMKSVLRSFYVWVFRFFLSPLCKAVFLFIFVIQNDNFDEQNGADRGQCEHEDIPTTFAAHTRHIKIYSRVLVSFSETRQIASKFKRSFRITIYFFPLELQTGPIYLIHRLKAFLFLEYNDA